MKGLIHFTWRDTNYREKNYKINTGNTSDKKQLVHWFVIWQCRWSRKHITSEAVCELWSVWPDLTGQTRSLQIMEAIFYPGIELTRNDPWSKKTLWPLASKLTVSSLVRACQLSILLSKKCSLQICKSNDQMMTTTDAWWTLSKMTTRKDNLARSKGWPLLWLDVFYKSLSEKTRIYYQSKRWQINGQMSFVQCH